MTSFGTGFFKTENDINFNFNFADFDFADHTTVFAVILVFFILFLVVLIWAQIHDMKDVKMVYFKNLMNVRLIHVFILLAAKTSLDV